MKGFFDQIKDINGVFDMILKYYIYYIVKNDGNEGVFRSNQRYQWGFRYDS